MLDQREHALESCRLFVSHDVEETEARIASVMQPHKLTPLGSSGDHTGHMDYLQLPSVGIGAISFGRMSLKLEHVEDYHLVVFCRRGGARLRSFGQEMDVRGVFGACMAPGDPLSGEFTVDAEQIVLKIDASSMRRYSGLRKPRLPARLDLRDERSKPWASLLRMLLTDPDMVDLVRQNRRVAADYDMLFFSMLLASGHPADDASRPGIAPASVKRAEDFIDAHFSEAITLHDVAAAAGVPVRTLFDGFRRFRDVSPMQHLRNRRLDAAHAALGDVKPGETVLSVALENGFGHLGRFAAEYSDRFGEKPSETLRRGNAYRSIGRQ